MDLTVALYIIQKEFSVNYQSFIQGASKIQHTFQLIDIFLTVWQIFHLVWHLDKLCHINNISIFYLYHTLLISSKLAKSENLPQFYFHSTLVLKFIQIYIKITDIVDVVSYLKTIKTKNLGQNKDNLINYLSKDYGYNKESPNKVIEKAVL